MSISSTITSPLMQTASENDMRKSRGSCTRGWAIDPQLWVEEWRRIHPTKTAQCVADTIKAPVRTVEKWLSGEARPSFDWFGPILCGYGIGFVAGGMATPVPWLDDMAREERRARLLAMREDIDAKLAEDWNRRRPA